MVKSVQFIKFIREIQIQKHHEMDIFRYLDQNYGKKSEALFQF